MVAAPRPVGIEIGGLDAVLLQVARGRAVGGDAAGRRDVVGRDRVAEQGQDPRITSYNVCYTKLLRLKLKMRSYAASALA